MTSTATDMRHLIAGEWTLPEDTDWFDVLDPSTGEILGRAPIASPELVDQAVAAAVSAAATWGVTTPKERADYLLALAGALDANAERIAELESRNVGKPLHDARDELPLITDLIRFYAGAARISHGVSTAEYTPGTQSSVLREPIGTVGLITPWNYPLLEAVWKIAPALAAGNTLVLKPSELTPCTTVELFRLAQNIFPAGVLNLVLGDGRTGAALVAHPDVQMVSLTGDVSTGKKIAAAAADTLKRVHLELGGKAPVLVFDDVDVSATARALAPLGFVNTGQDCTAACRIIVHQDVYDEFVRHYADAASALRVGAPSDPKTQIGPLISQRQADRVERFVQAAADSGATVLVGGGRPEQPGFFYPPTVITDVDQQNDIVQNEVFGPVVTIQKATDDDQMLQWANSVRYGLSSSIWTDSLARTQRFTRGLAFGTVWVNEHLTTVPEMPFGGFAESGYGKELSASSIDEYSRVKHVLIRT